MSHYINSWCSIHGDIEVDSDSVGCDQCAAIHYGCYSAIRDHLGGKPELVGELIACLTECSSLLGDAINEQYSDGLLAYPNVQRKYELDRAPVDRARALLSRIKEPSNAT